MPQPEVVPHGRAAALQRSATASLSPADPLIPAVPLSQRIVAKLITPRLASVQGHSEASIGAPSVRAARVPRTKPSVDVARASAYDRFDRPSITLTTTGAGKRSAKARAAGSTGGTRTSTAPRVLVVGCGALARELVELTRPLPNVDVACLPPELHNRPGGIPARVRARIRQGRREGYEQIFVAYADCGTGGLLDPVLADEGVERLPGAHCYEFFAGRTDFARLAEEEPGTFWLTDFLARNFERLVIRGLGIDKYPELEPMYFGNYRRLVYLSQTDDPDLLAIAKRAAERLGLAFEHRHTGYGELATSIQALGVADPRAVVQPVNTSDATERESAADAHPADRHDRLDHQVNSGAIGVRRAHRNSAPTGRRVARFHVVQTGPAEGGAA